MGIPTDNWVNETPTADVPTATEPETKPTDGAETADDKPKETGETPATPEKDPETEPAKQDDEEADEPEDEKGDLPKGVKKRIGKLSERAKEATERAIRAEERARLLEEQLSAKPAAAQASQDDPEPTAPKAEDFQTLQDYSDALTTYHKEVGAWSVRQELKRQTAENEARQRQAKAETETVEYNKSVEAKVRAAEKEYDDFVEVAIDNDEVVEIFETAPYLRDAIGMSDNFAKLAYYYGKKPAELEKLSKMDPRMALVELGKMEARLSATTDKKPSGAKPPIKPVDATGKVEIDEDKLTTAEWMARERKREAERRKDM